MLSIPAKGFYCEHMDGFDLESFVAMNSNYRSFKCPIGNKKSVDIYVDTLTQKMISILPENTEKIEIKEDLISRGDSGIDLDLRKLVEAIEKDMNDVELKEHCMTYKSIKEENENTKPTTHDSDDNNRSEVDESKKGSENSTNQILDANIKDDGIENVITSKEPDTAKITEMIELD